MRLRPLVAGTLAVLVAVAQIASAARAADEPYQIHAIMSLTGAAAFIGKGEAQSLQLIEALTNKAGGIRGRPISFVITDDQSNAANAVQIANDLISKRVPVFLGPNFTALCLAVLPLVVKSGPVDYCFSPAIAPPAGSYVYSSTVSTHDDAIAMARYIAGKKWNKVALLSTTDASGQSFEQSWDQATALPEMRALKVVAREHSNPADVSASAQATRIKAAEPDVVIAWAAGTPFGTLVHGLHDVGVEVPVFGGNGNMSYAQLGQYTDFLPKELYFSGRRVLAPDESAPAAVKKAQAVYHNAFNGIGVRPDLLNTLSWDAAMIVLDALRATGTANPTPAQVNGWIQKQKHWAGIFGFYDFTDGSQRGIGIDGAVIDRWDAAKKDFVAVSKPGGAPR